MLLGVVGRFEMQSQRRRQTRTPRQLIATMVQQMAVTKGVTGGGRGLVELLKL